MLNNEQVFEELHTKGKELSDWLAENFNPYTAIIITSDGVEIFEARYGYPISREED